MVDPEKDGDNGLRRVVSNFSTRDEDEYVDRKSPQEAPLDSKDLLMDLDNGVVGWDSRDDPYNPL